MNLRQLILKCCAELGGYGQAKSYRQVAADARAAPHYFTLSAATVSRLAKVEKLKRMPDEDTLKGLAIGLEVDDETVGRAALESVGLAMDGARVTDDGDVRFRVSGHGWDAEQLAAIIQAGEEGIAQEKQRQVRLAQRLSRRSVTDDASG